MEVPVPVPVNGDTASFTSTSISLCLTATFAIFLVYLSVTKTKAWRKLPPGPWGLPFIGSMYHLYNANVFAEFEKYRQKYGDIFFFRLGKFNAVALNGHKLIAEAFKRPEFIGRPDIEGWINKNMGVKNRGILFCDANHTWSEQRRFTLTTLRDFGFGKESMEGLLLHEFQDLAQHLRNQVGKPANIKVVTGAAVLNSLWYILTGNRFVHGDPLFETVHTLMSTNFRGSHLAGPGFWLPWPVKHNLIAKGRWAQLQANRKQILSLISEVVDTHIKTYVDGELRDFIDVYLAEYKKSDAMSSFSGEEGKTNLIVTLHDLFLAGAETTATTLMWALFFLSMDSRIQEKLFDEVNTVIGRGQLPSREHKPKMPYTEAVLNEVHRRASIFPLSVFHKTTVDTDLAGYFIPKDTVVFGNLYGAHYDKAYWGDPENFRPERFLDSTGTKLVKHEGLQQFSTGKRVCLGETLARDSLFLFLTGIVQQFSFTLAPSSAHLDPKAPPVTTSFVLQPEPFELILENRE